MTKVAQRLEEAMQDVLEPRFFGEGGDEFGYFFHLGEEWPRGQLNSLMMCNDLLTSAGDWPVTTPAIHFVLVNTRTLEDADGVCRSP